MLDLVRYWLALLFLVSWPAALTVWFVIHPLAAFWRRVGPLAAYAAAGACAVAVGTAMAMNRESLMAVEYGSHLPLMAAGATVLVVVQTLDLWVRRTLRLKILLGIPELSRDEGPGTLLTSGPFALVRHPRYSVLLFGLLGVALFSNYLAVYVMAALSLPLMILLAHLEERELVSRFGSAYEEYASHTPRFLPHRLKPPLSE